MVTIEAASPADLPAVLALLRHCGLPIDGLSEHLGTTLIARDKGAIVGSAALEIYDGAALLRSVAVAQAQRQTGLGQRIVRNALELARQNGIQQVFLLTETAENFFPRFGFRPIDRSAVPFSVQQSIEFTSACPSSARVLALDFDV